MKIIVDADACSVKKEIVSVAKKHSLDVIMLCDTSHIINDSYARVIVIGEGPDAVDFALINHTKKGDIVVSQDYGVASMALAKGAGAISNHGTVFTEYNIDSYLTKRYLSIENKRKGGRFYKSSAVKAPDTGTFVSNFTKLVKEHIKKSEELS